MPLTILTTGLRGSRELLPDALQAFNKIKSLLANVTLLAHPVHGAKLSLMVDASKTAVGAVLHQGVQDCRQPLAFFSKKLEPTESHSSRKMGFLAHVALNDPTPGKRVHSMTPPQNSLKKISNITLKKISPQ